MVSFVILCTARGCFLKGGVWRFFGKLLLVSTVGVGCLEHLLRVEQGVHCVKGLLCIGEASVFGVVEKHLTMCSNIFFGWQIS